MFGFLKKKANKNAKDFDKEAKGLEREFKDVYLQTQSVPLGDTQDAWRWALDKIAYFKEKGLERKKLYSLVMNVLINLTDEYIENFDEFRRIVNDVSPVINICEVLLNSGEAEFAEHIARPYVDYVLSEKSSLLDNKICYQNNDEKQIMLLEFSELKDKKQTDQNYTYLFVVYCRTLDSILITDMDQMQKRLERKKELLTIANQLSPWNSSVWNGLSKLMDSDEEYDKCIKNALRYAMQPDGPYGLNEIYSGLAMHYIHKDPKLAQALCVLCESNGGNALAAKFVLAKKKVSPLSSGEEAIRIIEKAGIQIGFSDLIISMIESMGM